MTEKKNNPQIWRKMQPSNGRYSVSNAGFLNFSAYVEYSQDFKNPTASLATPLRIVYRIDGDQINIAYFQEIGHAMAWLEQKLNKAIADNKTVWESEEDRTIEDT